MKRKDYSFLIILFLTLGILSCSTEALDSQLAGSWAAIGNINTGCADASDDSINNLECTGVDCQRYIFTDSSTFILEMTLDGATQSESGTYSVSGDVITFCEEDEEETICFTVQFVLAGTSLLIDSEDTESGCSTRTTFTKQ